jgi:hypothetical protein
MNIMKKTGYIGGIISGIISIVLSFVVNGMDTGSWSLYYEYGGDAYTGIQNSSAQAANNLGYLTELVQTGMFAFLLVFGIALVSFFIIQLTKEKQLFTKIDTKTPLLESSSNSIEANDIISSQERVSTGKDEPTLETKQTKTGTVSEDRLL